LRESRAAAEDDVIQVDHEGNALYRQRFQATLTAPGDFSHFPFDRRAMPAARNLR
jgi:hypothetical protein